MLLEGGTLDGHRYLSPTALQQLASPEQEIFPTGFFQSETYGRHGTNYGWGIGTCVLRAPHEGVAEVLSSGSFGHGGAWGTQAWIDPVRGCASTSSWCSAPDFPNSDASDVRRDFQRAASRALVTRDRR